MLIDFSIYQFEYIYVIKQLKNIVQSINIVIKSIHYLIFVICVLGNVRNTKIINNLTTIL